MGVLGSSLTASLLRSAPNSALQMASLDSTIAQVVANSSLHFIPYLLFLQPILSHFLLTSRPPLPSVDLFLPPMVLFILLGKIYLCLQTGVTFSLPPYRPLLCYPLDTSFVDSSLLHLTLNATSTNSCKSVTLALTSLLATKPLHLTVIFQLRTWKPDICFKAFSLDCFTFRLPY